MLFQIEDQWVFCVWIRNFLYQSKWEALTPWVLWMCKWMCGIPNWENNELLLSCVLCMLLGAQSTSDLPCGSNALLWQEAWGLEVRILPWESGDSRSGLCHHLRYSNHSYAALCVYECGVSSLLYLSLSHTGEVQKMLEEKNVTLNEVEPAPLDTM